MKRKPAYAFFLLTLPTVVVAGAVLLLMTWHIPTRVELDITANRVEFVLGGTSSTYILNLLKFQSLTIEKFAQITLNPEKLELAEPAQYIEPEDRYPESAWTSLTLTAPVVITGQDQRLQPAVTVESVKPGLEAAGTLDRVWGKPGADVTLEVRDARRAALTAKIEAQESSVTLLLHEPFQLIIEYGSISGLTESPYIADSMTYRAQLPNHSPDLRITGQPSSLVLMVTISSKQVVDLSPKGGIPVTALDFTRQNVKGERETSLVEVGELTYPDYPEIERIPLKASDFIGLGGLKKFRIEQIMLDPERKGARFRLNGVATDIGTGSREFSKDRRLTRFDTIWQNPRLVILFSIIVWVFPTTVGAVRLYKDIKKERE